MRREERDARKTRQNDLHNVGRSAGILGREVPESLGGDRGQRGILGGTSACARLREWARLARSPQHFARVSVAAREGRHIGIVLLDMLGKEPQDREERAECAAAPDLVHELVFRHGI